MCAPPGVDRMPERATRPRPGKPDRWLSLEAPLAVLPLGRLHGVPEHDGGGEHERADHEAGRRSTVTDGAVEARRRSRSTKPHDGERRTGRSRPAGRARRSGRCGPGARGRGRRAASAVTATSLPQRAGRRGRRAAGRGRSAARASAALWSWRAGSGWREERVERRGVGRGRTTGTRGPGAPRPPGRGRRPPAGGGWPPRSAGCRTPPRWTGRPRRRRPRRRRPSCPAAAGGSPGTPRRGQHVGQLVVVAVLGRARRASRWRRAPRPGATAAGTSLRGDGPHRVERRAARRSATSSAARVRGAVAGRLRRRRTRCRSWWPRCPARPARRSVSWLIVTWRHAGSSGGSSVTWARAGRCHGGSWWCRTAGRPRSAAATTRAAGRFSGIVQRFSTTTRSAPASAAATSSGSGLGGRAELEPGHEVVDGPVAGHGASPSSRARSSTRCQVAATTDTPS